MCPCGVRDDDGERMAACDACAAWAHTRCAGTSDCDPVPRLFLCAACSAAGVLPLPGAPPTPSPGLLHGAPVQPPISPSRHQALFHTQSCVYCCAHVHEAA